jgi:hypothetical protein
LTNVGDNSRAKKTAKQVIAAPAHEWRRGKGEVGRISTQGGTFDFIVVGFRVSLDGVGVVDPEIVDEAIPTG